MSRASAQVAVPMLKDDDLIGAIAAYERCADAQAIFCRRATSRVGHRSPV
jgi:hypothetical protein